MRHLLLVVVVVALLSSSTRAQDGAPRQRLSDRGRQIVDGSLIGSWSSGNEANSLFPASNVSVSLQPSWLLFVRDRIGLGAYAGYRYARGSFAHPFVSDLGLPPSAWHYRDNELSAGITSALELYESGRFSLFLRPYLGLAVRWREHDVLELSQAEAPFAGDGVSTFSRRQQARDVRLQAGFRIPFTYQISSALGLGLGPDFLWQNLFDGHFNAYRIGISSWLARSF